MSDLENQNPSDPRIKKMFVDLCVSMCETGTRRWVSMELRGRLQSFHCDVEATQRGLTRCEELAQKFDLPLRITPEAIQWMQLDQPCSSENGLATARSTSVTDPTLSQTVTRLRALARRAPTELAMLDSVANELMRQSFALEDAADMLHECASECADCGSHGRVLSGAPCEACAPIREAERLARAACTPVMDLDVDARLWEALKAAVLRSPRMQPLFEGGPWLELGIQHVLTWLSLDSRTATPVTAEPLSRTPLVGSGSAGRGSEAESGSRQGALIRQLASAMAQLREAGLAAEAETHARILRDAGIEIEDNGVRAEEGGLSL